MVDYVNTEIVAYADNTSDNAFSVFPFYFEVDGNNGFKNFQYGYTVEYYIYRYTNYRVFDLSFADGYGINFFPVPYNADPETGELPDDISEWQFVLGLVVKSITFNDGSVYEYSYEDSVKTFGGQYVSLCVDQDSLSEGASKYYFVRIPKDYIWVIPPDFPATDKYHPTDFDILQNDTTISDDIYFLYNIGQMLVSKLIPISDILQFKIGNQNLITLLFGGGFIVYVSWIIIKWFIPL